MSLVSAILRDTCVGLLMGLNNNTIDILLFLIYTDKCSV